METDSFFQTLHARRTQRNFSEAPVSLDDVSKLLHTTWGVQGYLESKYFGPLPLKTSPSGGARQPHRSVFDGTQGERTRSRALSL